MVITLIATLALGQGPEFIGDKVGELLPVSTPYANETVDPKLVSALLRIKSPGMEGNRFSGIPPQSESKHFLRTVKDHENGYLLIAIPYATDTKHRDVTLKIGRDAYQLRLPVSQATLSTSAKSITKRVGSVTVTAAPATWRFTTAPRLLKVSAKNESKQPALVGATWIPAKTKGPWQDTMLGYGDVRLMDAGQSTTLALTPHEGARKMEVRALSLEPAPIKLAVSGGTSTVPLQYSLNGKLIYNRYHKLSQDSGFVALQVNNIYLSNFGIRNRPAGNLPSYTTLRDGDSVNATGFRAKSKTPATGQLTVEQPKTGLTQTTTPPSNFYITPR